MSEARNPALTRLKRRRKPRASLQVSATIHVDDLPGDEITPEQEDYGLRNIPRPTMPLKRQSVGMTLEITLIVEAFALRPQVQERLTDQIADAIMEGCTRWVPSVSSRLRTPA